MSIMSSPLTQWRLIMLIQVNKKERMQKQAMLILIDILSCDKVCLL